VNSRFDVAKYEVPPGCAVISGRGMYEEWSNLICGSTKTGNNYFDNGVLSSISSKHANNGVESMIVILYRDL
jgi:hypothetical protein